MPVKFTDQDVLQMIQEIKPLPVNYLSQVQLRNKRGHKERELDIAGAQGNQYRLILRQSHFNLLDFSIILAINPSDSNTFFRLRRYNGKSHEHTNQIEGNTSTIFTFIRPLSDTRNSEHARMHSPNLQTDTRIFTRPYTA